ncbi:MAG: hypothetical protein DLM68_14005 [Hyphomicrobiales bacterium]|nr:MAG: hypothetical protein DLM68_14005 [Hyphomicrobiales bacterium]
MAGSSPAMTGGIYGSIFSRLGIKRRSRFMRTKTHSSLGGRKAHLHFELKDAPKARRLWRSQILDFRVQMRSAQPSDEWDGVAGTNRRDKSRHRMTSQLL